MAFEVTGKTALSPVRPELLLNQTCSEAAAVLVAKCTTAEGGGTSEVAER